MNNIDIDQAASSAYDLGCQFLDIAGSVKPMSQPVVVRAFFEYLTQEGDEPLIARQTSLIIQLRNLKKDVEMYSKGSKAWDNDTHMYVLVSQLPVFHIADFIKKSFVHLAGIMKAQHPLTPEDLTEAPASTVKPFMMPKIKL